MVINRNNLSIAIHCGEKAVQGYAANVLYVTEKGTLALEGTYSVAVSALQKEPGDIVGFMTTDVANSLGVIGATNVSPSLVTPLVADKIPPTDKLLADKPVLFEMFLNANILAKIIQSAIDFDAKGVIRLQFAGKLDPVRMESRNIETGQQWEAFIMPRMPGIDEERYAKHPQPCSDGLASIGECVCVSDFDKAMAEALRLS